MSYSTDLRERAVAYRLAGNSLRKTAETFRVSHTIISDWVNQFKEEGTLKKKPLKRTFRKIDPEGLRVFIANHPDAYLREIAKEFHCSISGIRKALKCLGITRKKKQLTTRRRTPKK